MFRVKQSGQPDAQENSCKPCPVTASSPVCGTDGHNYASEVKFKKQELYIFPWILLLLLYYWTIKTLKRNGKLPCHGVK